MMKRVVALAVTLAACGTHRSPKPMPAEETSAAAGLASGSATVVKAGRERIEAPHGAAITALAATPDGMAAASVDELGGVRLWPALDGSVEPRVVDLGHPEALAIVARDAGFAIASIDGARGLTITTVDRDGLTQQRTAFSVEPGFAGVLAIERGFLAWRLDHRVLKLGSDGSVAHELVTEPGQRIAALATAGGRVVAAIDSTHPTRRARWITLGAKLAWGGWIEAGPVGVPLALSPSGRRLAYLTENRHAVVFETATGKQVPSDRVAAGIAIGMVDDDRVALARPGGAVFWLDIGTTKPVLGSAIAMPAAEPALPLAIGGGRTIGAHDSQLVISTPGTNHYLGYQLPSPAVASAAPSGGLLLGLGTTFALLDPTLVASRTAPDLMIPGGSTVADLRWLGGDEWVVESSRAKDGVSAISLVDTRRKTSVLVRDGMAEVQMLRYEPSTKLVTLSLGDQPQVLRHEPGNRSTRSRVAKVSALSMPVGTAEIFPLAPQLAGGVHLVVVHAHHGVTIRWVAEPRALDRGVTQVGVALANVDAAGHVFVWQSLPDSRLELVVYANGKRVGTLPSDGPIEVFPDRAGERVLQIGQRNLSLVTLDGATVWTQSIHGVREALWLDDGGLAVISAAGVARLDPATGEVVAARCGWHFGLEDKPHPPASHLEPLCTQLR